MNNINVATLIDGYKLDHRRQYPLGTGKVYSNFTPRTSRVEGVNKVVFFGLQYFLIEYLFRKWNNEFYGRPLEEVAEKYAAEVNSYLGPNQIGTDHIKELWSNGYLPITIRALPEGTHVPLNVPMLTIENTDNRFWWLTNYFETILSCILWLPCTSATTAYRFRKTLEQYAIATGSPREFVDWQGHDFSFRGMAGLEAAMMSGAGHLTSFTGTDTMPAINFIREYYMPNKETLIGGSVAATEHSVMCAGGDDNELDTFNRLLDLYPRGVLSVVSDTWDLWNVIGNILPQIKTNILNRPGKLVIRPDSGDPVKIICGDARAEHPSEKLGVIQLLWNEFGGTLTSSGHRLLDSHIGAIYGDSINHERLEAILHGLHEKGFASANMVFGIGSFTYQYVTRDTYGFAIKSTWCEINGIAKDIYKDPVTDDGGKKSAKGRLAVLMNEEGQLYLLNQATREQEISGLMSSKFINGMMPNMMTFEQIRENVRKG